MQPSSSNKQLNVLEPPLYRQQRALPNPLAPKQCLQPKDHRLDPFPSLWHVWDLNSPHLSLSEPVSLTRNTSLGTRDGTWALCGLPQPVSRQRSSFWTASSRLLLTAEESWVLASSSGTCQLYLPDISPPFSLYFVQFVAFSFSSLPVEDKFSHGWKEDIFCKIPTSKVCHQLLDDHTLPCALGTWGRQQGLWSGQVLCTRTAPSH